MSYSVNSYSSLSSTKAVFGLASGMNTEEIIEQMTTSTRSKIATQLQEKQLALWTQDAYREITTKLIDFNKQYFSNTGSDSLLRSNNYDVSVINNSSDYLNISGDSDIASNMIIRDIQSLATKASFSSSVASDMTITTGSIESEWQANLIQSADFTFTYGSTDYTLTTDSAFAFADTDTTDELKLDAIIAELNDQINNNAELTAKLQFSKVSDGSGGFNVELQNTVAPEDIQTIEIQGGSSILLNGLGFTTGQTSDASGIVTSSASADVSGFYEDRILSDSLSGVTMTFDLNGIDAEILFDESDPTQYQDITSLQSYLQTSLDDAYGSGAVTVSIDTDHLVFSTADSTSILTIQSADESAVLGTNGALHVAAGESNRLELSKTLEEISSEMDLALTTNAEGKYEISVNNEVFTFETDDLLGDVIYEINHSDAGVKINYLSTNNSFSVTAQDTGSNGQVNITDSNGSNLASSLFGSYTVTDGQDAVIEVSFDAGATYQTVTRSTNSFTLDGVNLELLSKADGAELENISFTTSTDVDALYDNISSFISDYNEIIELISSKLNETQSGSEEYLPLTQEQKEDMSDDEIENWETEAKKSLLRNDEYLADILNDLRSAVTTMIEESDLSLAQIGIATEAYAWEDNGKLIIDEDKLRSAITEDPETIKEIFLHNPDIEGDMGQSGIAYRIQDILERNVNTLGTDGILIHLAGISSDNSDSDNVYTDRIESIDKQLEQLKQRLQTEEKRYISQFSALETYISRMNQQSEWLTQMMSS